MSNYNDSNKINKKKKKRKEMPLEDYAKKYNINIKISFKFEDDTEQFDETFLKSNFSIYQSNLNCAKNNDSLKIKKNNIKGNDLNKRELELEEGHSSTSLNIAYKTRASASTNNSSFEENKINNNEKNEPKKNNQLVPDNIKHNDETLSYNNKYQDRKEYNNFNINNNSNYNPYFVNNNFNRNFYLNNYIYKFNINLYNYNCMLKANYYLYFNKFKINKNYLKEIEIQINALEKKSLLDMFLLKQSAEIINYIKTNKNLINTNISNIDNNQENKEKENPEHPYFYTNHYEEIQIKNVLYLIEGLFNKDNLVKDFNLLIMLNRDGYASLSQLEKHPQVKLCGVTESHLKTVFSEHRGNEITETVETFDDILIRNKGWVKIKKEINDIEEIKKKVLDSMRNLKEIEMKNLLEKKRNYLNIEGDILYQYQVSNYNIQQKMNELRFNFNNIYNNNFNDNIFNNNVYNNFYNNNRRC